MKTKKLILTIFVILTGIFSSVSYVKAVECTGINTPPGCTQVNTKYQLLAPLPDGAGGLQKEFNVEDESALGNYINIIITLTIGISAVLAVVMIVMGGIQYMGNELISSKEEGSQRIWNAILGLLIALGAYALLNTINPDLLKSDINIPDAKVTVALIELADGTYSSSGGAGAGIGGTCSVETKSDNACSTEKLASSCFGNRVNEASKICSLESGGGRTDVKSGSDLLNNGSGPSYSVGLWQINLTVHKVGGLDCPSAFTGKCGKGTVVTSGSKVGNCSASIKPDKMDLYNQCVQAAQDPVKNTQVACKLYGENGSSFAPWAYSANKCSVPKK